tara:strand:- start:185 stop:868 length:684 start_codon:yes stop_codon:yes gene_type:complete
MKIKPKKIAPSLLAADFANMERDIKMVEHAGVELLHIDVMDGHFVPNISYGIPVLKAVKRVSNIPCDVHLMISNPQHYIEAFVSAGASYLTVHVEATTHLHRLVQHIKSHGIKAGVALNPHTPLSSIEEILEEVDLILLMSVNPGFGGQHFIENTLKRLERMSKVLQDRGLDHIELEVDGGIKLENLKKVADAGADIFVSGSGIFKAENPVIQIQKMKELIQPKAMV